MCPVGDGRADDGAGNANQPDTDRDVDQPDCRRAQLTRPLESTPVAAGVDPKRDDPAPVSDVDAVALVVAVVRDVRADAAVAVDDAATNAVMTNAMRPDELVAVATTNYCCYFEDRCCCCY